jgi:ribosome maturation factor RimP
MTGDELAKLLEPAVERLGYELSDLEVKLGGKNGVVRVFIDKPNGIALADCEIVSSAVSALLDVEEPS